MFLDEELEALKRRIGQKSDGELLQMIEVEYDDYRPEALDFAKAELSRRRISFEEPEISDDSDGEEEFLPRVSTEPCAKCGGMMRSGLLFADKELTILFPENNEERFVQAFACPKCGDVRLSVDFNTDVEG